MKLPNTLPTLLHGTLRVGKETWLHLPHLFYFSPFSGESGKVFFLLLLACLSSAFYCALSIIVIRTATNNDDNLPSKPSLTLSIADGY